MTTTEAQRQAPAKQDDMVAREIAARIAAFRINRDVRRSVRASARRAK